MSREEIPGHVRAVLELFDAELGELRFGDVDRSCLDEHVSAFREAAEREAAAYLALQEARRELDGALFRLEERAERAAAYARVYARDHEPLAARLEEIEAMRPGAKPKKKKRRSKPKKVDPPAPPAAELPFAVSS